jgi:Sec-independent protein translocase protein TatA
MGEWVGEHVGDFWDSIGNVNEINTSKKRKQKSKQKNKTKQKTTKQTNKKEVEAKDQKFKVIFSYIMRLRPAGDM